MTESRRLLDRLREARVTDAITWAYASAIERTLLDYSEDAGHDASWLGQTRHILFRDRLDRVFSCGRYALVPGADDSEGLDLVHAQLTDRDIATMPALAPDLVSRGNLNGSPGWVFQDFRFLLASSLVGKIDSVPWTQKSPTKQQVARQSNPEPPPTLFDDLPPEVVGGLVALTAGPLDLDTYVVSHSLDPINDRRELVFGLPRLNSGGGDAWHWYEDLLASPPRPGGQRPNEPVEPSPSDIPDAPVRLRRKPAEESPGAQA